MEIEDIIEELVSIILMQEEEINKLIAYGLITQEEIDFVKSGEKKQSSIARLLEVLKELENQSLARELEIEIERKIRESGALKDVHPDAREETKRALYQTYYEMLINSDKYKSLNKFN